MSFIRHELMWLHRQRRELKMRALCVEWGATALTVLASLRATRFKLRLGSWYTFCMVSRMYIYNLFEKHIEPVMIREACISQQFRQGICCSHSKDEGSGFKVDLPFRVRVSGSPPFDHTVRVCVRVSTANSAPCPRLGRRQPKWPGPVSNPGEGPAAPRQGKPGLIRGGTPAERDELGRRVRQD